MATSSLATSSLAASGLATSTEEIYPGVPAASPPVADDVMFKELKIHAARSSYSEQKDTFTAEGNVQASLGEIVLSTQLIVIDIASSTLTAPGDITLIRPGTGALSGKNLVYNYKQRTGELSEASACFTGVNVKGERMSLTKEQTLVFRNAVASTCGFSSMDYHVTADTVEINEEGRVFLKKIGLYIKNRKVLKWGSFSASTKSGLGKKKAAPAAEKKKYAGFRFSPPAGGYSNPGGLNVRTSLYRTMFADSTLSLKLGLYLAEGLFPEVEFGRKVSRTKYWSSYGRQFKESSGYQRYRGPVKVWNLPMAGADFGQRLAPHTKILFRFSTEAGRMKEKQLSRPLDRIYTVLGARYPLNPGHRVEFSLTAEEHYAVYSSWKKYRVLTEGLAVDYALNARSKLSLEFADFRVHGATFFFSDYIDPNERIFALLDTKIDRKTGLRIDSEFDLEDRVFREVEYDITRTYNCVRLEIGWRKELKTFMLRAFVLGLNN